MNLLQKAVTILVPSQDVTIIEKEWSRYGLVHVVSWSVNALQAVIAYPLRAWVWMVRNRSDPEAFQFRPMAKLAAQPGKIPGTNNPAPAPIKAVSKCLIWLRYDFLIALRAAPYQQSEKMRDWLTWE